MRLVTRETTEVIDNRHTSKPNQAGHLLGACLFLYVRWVWHLFVPQTFSLRFVVSESRMSADFTDTQTTVGSVS